MIDIYAAVTDRIIAQLENGVIPWRKPWVGVGNTAAVSWEKGKAYSLLNQILLGEPGEYITFGQCKKAGGKIKKGAKSRIIVFWKMLEKPVTDESGRPVMDKDGKPKMQTIPFLNYYNVFHIRDIEGVEPKRKTPELPNTAHPVESAEKVICGYTEKYGIELRHEQGDRAFYSPGTDSITLPLLAQFAETAEYYSTAFHELTHSTGHSSRLNRLEKAGFGSDSYSKEELVAEIGSASLMNEMGFETESSFRNSVAYIQNWLKALRGDKKLIVSATSRAEKAVEMIIG